MRHGLARALLLLLATSMVPAASSAQRPPAPVGPVLRSDALLSDLAAFHVGVGAARRAGNYLRGELVGAAGANEDGEFSGRVEGVLHFLFDPLRERRVGWYAGGGVGVRYDQAPGWRGTLIAVVGVQAQRRGAWTPFLEAGIGGGARVGVGVRGG